LVCSYSLTITWIYCTGDHGLCRPLPLKFYLLGLPFSGKFVRDPLSLSVTLAIILLIIVMQLCIEVRKHSLDKIEQETLEMAIIAQKNLVEAQLHLQQEQHSHLELEIQVEF